MKDPYFQTILYSTVPFVHYFSEDSKGKKAVFSFTKSLIVLLDTLSVHRGQVLVKLAIPPIYFSLLDQPEFKKQMDDFLLEGNEKRVYSLWDKWEGHVNRVITQLIQEKKLDLLGLPATGVPLPFLTTTEGIQMQIKTGNRILSDIFGFKPEGFWFPEGAYTPGLDLSVRNESYLYSYINQSTVTYADPPPCEDHLSIYTPHGLMLYPIHKQLSEILDKSTEETFITVLKEEIKNKSELRKLTTFTIATNLENFIEKMDLLHTISYFADEGFLSVQQDTSPLLDSNDTVHICSSFLSEGMNENHFQNIKDFLTPHITMEQEIQQLTKTPRTTEEIRVIQQMTREWMMFSGLLFTPHISRREALSYLDRFERLQTCLVDGSDNEYIDLCEDKLKILKQVQIDVPKAKNKVIGTNEHMKILVLSWEFPPYIVGGLARHVHGLTRSLSRKGYEIHVLTAWQNGLLEEEIVDGVFVHRVKPIHENEKDFLKWVGGLNIAISEKAIDLTNVHKFDCIHAHDWLVGSSASVLKGYLDIPLVTTIHATEFGRNNGIYTEMQRFIHEKEKQLVEISDQIIVCSDYMKEEVLKLFNPPLDKLISIPNGIENEPMETDEQTGLLDDIPMDFSRKMIFSIGRVVREKGFETIIDAAEILKSTRSDIYFIIAGKGPLLEDYRRQVFERNLADFVYFIGFIDDKKRNALFEECHIAVFPSLYEPFGIVALESMKAGKPTIVSNTGGLKGIVQHLKTGLLMVPGNTESLAEQLLYLLDNEDTAIKIGGNGKKVVESLFSWNRVAEETKRVLEDVKVKGKIKHVNDNIK